MPADTPEPLNAELLARIVELERQIGELRAELTRHQSGRAESLLSMLTAKARDTEIDDHDFRQFVRRSVRED